jgi:hypothetical protein
VKRPRSALGAFITLASAGAVGFSVGCAHQKPDPPDVVRDFAQSVARGDWDRGYALMSDDYRQRVSLAKFRADLETERRTVSADAVALSRQTAWSPVRAVVETPAGDRFHLTLDGARWRLDEPPLAPFGQQTPRAALRTFVRAIDLKRYDVLLKLVPARHRPGVTEASLRAYWEGTGANAHRRLLETLRANLNTPIVDLGVEAFLPYGSSNGTEVDRAKKDGEGEVHFLLEDGIWKIDDAG